MSILFLAVFLSLAAVIAFLSLGGIQRNTGFCYGQQGKLPAKNVELLVKVIEYYKMY